MNGAAADTFLIEHSALDVECSMFVFFTPFRLQSPSMHVVIFEGSQWTTFAPLCLNRPVFMLSTGMSTLLDKQIRYLGATRLTLWVRPEMVDFCKTRVLPHLKIPTKVNEPLDDEAALLVSGRTLHFRKFDTPDHECVVVDGEMI